MAYPNIWISVESFMSPNLTEADLKIFTFMVADAGRARVFDSSRDKVAAAVKGRNGKRLSIRTVTDSWARLEREGLIERVSRGSKFGVGRAHTAKFRITDKGAPGSKVPTATKEPSSVLPPPIGGSLLLG